jgi:hypothetical protein
MTLLTQFGIELETLIIVPQTPNILIKKEQQPKHTPIRKNLSLYLAKSTVNENDPKFAFQNEDGEIVDPNTADGADSKHNVKFDRWVVCSDESVEYQGSPKQFYTSIGRPKEDEKIKTNHWFLLNSTIASMLASPIGWKPINNIELVSPVLTLGDYSQIEYVFEHLTKQTPPAPMFFHNTTTSTHVHMSIKNNEEQNVFMDPINLLKICCAWLSFEPLFFSFVAPWRQSTGYCKKMRELIGQWGQKHENVWMLIDHYVERYNEIEDKTDENQLNELLLTLVSSFQGTNRYAALNLHNLVHINVDKKGRLLHSNANAKKTGAIPLSERPLGTIECRILHGTTDKEEIINFVELLSAFFQAAMDCEIDILKGYVKNCWTSLEFSLQQLEVFLGKESWGKIRRFCSQRYNVMLSDPDPDFGTTLTPLRKYTYHGIVDSDAGTLYIRFKNIREELIFMSGLNRNIEICEIQILPMNANPNLFQINLRNLKAIKGKTLMTVVLAGSVVLKRDEAIKLVKDLKTRVTIRTNEEQMLGIEMDGGKIYLKNKNLKPLNKFIKTTRRYVGKDKVSRVIYVKGKAEYTKRKSVVGFEYVRIRAPKPRS